ncbi:sugar ABC transporter ATP-binding protein [bacterium]|nr:sugar ABC transporter ATP-binding protein [bacterium]
MGQALLEISGLSKSYSSVALSEANLEIMSGEVHVLVGENGAGKSTMARIISGIARQDTGDMRLQGRPFSPRSRNEAEKLGVRIVMQELNLINTLTIAENIFIDRMFHRYGWIDYPHMNRKAHQLMDQVGIGQLNAAQFVETLGIGEQQLVEIAGGLSKKCKLLILDEPTAALTGEESNLLFAQVARLRNEEVGILYITHRLEEINLIADRVTVLRDGKVVSTFRRHDVTLDDIVRMMVGGEFSHVLPRGTKSDHRSALRVQGLNRGARVKDISFVAYHGEILGFAGLVGSGRTETMRAVFGADAPESGRIYLYGSNKPSRIRSPRDAVRQGIALLSEDRKKEGLLLPLPVRANITLPRLKDVAPRPGLISTEAERSVAEFYIRRMSVLCSSMEQPVRELSGGNQQKTSIAKWIYCDCNVLIFDEPTRGIDVASKFEIHRLLSELASHGKAIIVVSSDIKELMALCDRIAVMSNGRLAAVLEHESWTMAKILKAALSNSDSSNQEGNFGVGQI